MATIRDVAKLANVSCGTVSNFINGKYAVSLKKQKAIIEAMEALNYETNSAAKALKAKTSSDIGFVFPNLFDSYYQKILIGVESYVSNQGYSLSVHTTNNNPEAEIRVIQELLQRQVAGILLITCQPENTAFFKAKILKKNVPIVLIDRKIFGLVMNFTGCDNAGSVHQITADLLKKGKTKIAFVGGPNKFTDQAEAYEGYVKAFSEKGDKVPEELVFQNITNQEAAFSRMLDLYGEYSPEAVVTTSEELALGIREAIKLYGKTAIESTEIHALGEENWLCKKSSDLSRSNRRAITLGKEAASILCSQISEPTVSDIVMRTVEDGKSYSGSGERREDKPRSDKTLKLTMMKMISSEALNRLIPIYEKQFGINVEVEMVEHSNYHHYLRQRLSSDNPPDIVLVDTLLLPILVREHALLPLDRYIEDSKMDLSFYAEGCLERVCRQQGKLYGLPIYYTPQILLYRKDFFLDNKVRNKYESKTGIRLRPPRTWAEFDTIANFFTEKYNPDSPVRFGTSLACKYPECMSSEIRVRMQAYRGKITDGRKILFDSPENQKAFFYVQQSIKYCPPNYADKDRAAVESDFVSGNSAMITTFESVLYKAFNQNMLDKIGVSMVPGFRPVLGGWCLGIPSNAVNHDEAFHFLRWGCGKDMAVQQLILSGQTVDKDLLKNDVLSHRFPWLDSWREALQASRPPHPILTSKGKMIEASEIDKVLYKVAYKIIEEQFTVEHALQWGQQEFRDLFEL